MTSSAHKIGPFSGSQPSQVPFFDNTEDRMILDILHFLPLRDILTCERLNTRFCRIIKDDSLWKMLFAKRFPGAKESQHFPFTKDNYRRGAVFQKNIQEGIYTRCLLASSLPPFPESRYTSKKSYEDWMRISEDHKTVIAESSEDIHLFDVEQNKIFSLSVGGPFSWLGRLERDNAIMICKYGHLEENDTTYLLDIKDKSFVFGAAKEGLVYRLKNNKVAVLRKQDFQLFDLTTRTLIASAKMNLSGGPGIPEVRETAAGSIITLSGNGLMAIWELRPPGLHRRFEDVQIRFFLETEEGAIVCMSSEELIILSSDGKEDRIPLPHPVLHIASKKELTQGKILLIVSDFHYNFSKYVVDIHLKQIKHIQTFPLGTGSSPFSEPLPDPFFKEVCLFHQEGVLQVEEIKTMLYTSSERKPWGRFFETEKISHAVFCGPAQVMGLTKQGVILWDFGVSQTTYLAHSMQQSPPADIEKRTLRDCPVRVEELGLQEPLSKPSHTKLSQ